MHKKDTAEVDCPRSRSKGPFRGRTSRCQFPRGGSGTGTRDSRPSPSPAAGQRALCAGGPKPDRDRHQHFKFQMAHKYIRY